MSNQQTSISATSKNGDHVQVTQHQTDSPVLPVTQLRQLHDFRPDLVDWVIAAAETEANERRARLRRLDRYILWERIGGQILGALIAVVGLVVAAWVAINGQPWVAAAIGGGTLVGIVTVSLLPEQDRHQWRRHRPLPIGLESVSSRKARLGGLFRVLHAPAHPMRSLKA